jgi:diamine N-acetyltransferase
VTPAAADHAGVELRLRPARVADAPWVALLAGHVYLDTYGGGGLSALLAREVLAVHGRRPWQHRIARSEGRVVLAERGAHLIGVSELLRGSDDVPVQELAGCVELARLYVHPQAQGQGVGRRLVDDALAHAESCGSPALWLTAWAGNQRALDFYAALGFEDIGTTVYRFEDQTFENRVLRHRLPRPSSSLGQG